MPVEKPEIINLSYDQSLRHLSLSGAPSLALLLPSLTSSPDLEAWPDRWVSVSSSAPPSLGRGGVAAPAQPKLEIVNYGFV